MSLLRSGLAAAALLAGGVYLALGTGPFLRWLAAAALLVGACELAPLLRGRVPARVRGAAPYLVLGLLAAALLGEFALGRPPATRDHAIHYFQTELLVHDLVPAGRLSGWSDRLGNGYTLGDSYPVLGYLWMGAAHLLSFGLVPLRVSYAWGILAMWLLAAVGVWQLAAMVMREIAPADDTLTDGQKTVSWPAWAGCAGASLWLLDSGASREGGWEYLMFHGVWPQLLATSLWVVSLPATLRALREPSLRRIAISGGLLGLAVLAHPFALLMVGSSAAVWAGVLLLRVNSPEFPRAGRFRSYLAIHALAAALFAGWLAGFLANAHTMGRSPVPWLSWGELVTRFLAGELFENHRAWVGPLALLGLGLALRRGAALAWLTVGLFFVSLVLASDAAITVLRLDLLVSAFKNLQFPRYAIVLKPMWFAAAGVGAAFVFLSVRRLRSPDPDFLQTSGQKKQESEILPTLGRFSSSKVAVWTGCILLAPVLAGLLEDRSRLYPQPVGGRGTLEGSAHGASVAELDALLKKEEEATPGAPLRIAFLRQGMGGGTSPIFAVADRGAGLVLDGHIPSINSVYRVNGRSPALLRALGVTHVLHDRRLGKRDRALAEALTPVGTAGAHTLERLGPAGAQAPGVPGLATWTVRGLTVTATRHDAHAVDLDVAGGTTPARIDLLATPDRNWHATFVPADGTPTPLELTPASLFAGEITGTRVTLPGPGRLELRYARPARERRLGWLSLVAALAALAALAFPRPLRFAGRLVGPTARRVSIALSALIAALVLALAVRRQTAQLARTWNHVARDASFVADLVDIGAYAVTMRPSDLCDGLAGRDARAGCSPARDRPRRATLFRDPYLYRCLWVTVPPRGRTEVRFAAPDGTRVTGALQRQTPHLRPNKKLSFQVGDGPRRKLGDRLERLDRADRVELHNGGGEPERVCISAAAVE